MKAYQDRTTGLWKWGTRGQPIYDSKIQAERGGLDILTNRLREINDKLNRSLLNYGK